MDCELIEVGGYLGDKPVFSVVEGFSAPGHEQAAQYVKSYRESHPECEGKKIYYRQKEDWQKHRILYEGGIIVTGEISEVDEFFMQRIGKLRTAVKRLNREIKQTSNKIKMYRPMADKRKILLKVARLKKLSKSKLVRRMLGLWIKFSDWAMALKDKWADMFNDFKFEWHRLSEFKRTGHDVKESWSLDNHMLGVLRWNLNVLLKTGHGISMAFISESIHEKAEREGLSREYIDEHWDRLSSEVEDRAIDLQNQTYSRIIGLIDEYMFYGCTEIGELNSENTASKLKEPILDETYDMVDYRKMEQLAEDRWNQIWELFRKYGRGMWD